MKNVVLKTNAPVVLSFIVEDRILNLLLIRIGINTYLLLPLVYPILQLITYLRNHIYLPHLDLLLYFTPDKQNDELVGIYLLLPPILEPQQIPPLPKHLLHNNIHLLPQPHLTSLPKVLPQTTHLSLHHCPNHYPITPPANLCLVGVGGVRSSSWNRGVNGG